MTKYSISKTGMHAFNSVLIIFSFFVTTALTLKLKLASTHDGQAPTVAIEEIYEKCKNLGIPVEKWPRWIESYLLKNYGESEIPAVCEVCGMF